MGSSRRELFNRTHLTVNPSRRGVPDVTFFGHYNYSTARPGLTLHRHAGTLEICYLVRGRQNYRVGGADYRLTGGDVFVTFPGEWHDTGGLPQEKGMLYWIALRVQSSRETFLGHSGRRAAALATALMKLPGRHFRGSPPDEEQLDALLQACHGPAQPLRALTITNLVEAFALEVIERARQRLRSPAPSGLAPVLAHIHAHLDEPSPVPALASLAGLSTGRFKARFKQEVGMPPGEYVLRARVEEAARRLERSDADITTVAYELGFSSSQYFATVFKRFTGETPSGKRRSPSWDGKS